MKYFFPKSRSGKLAFVFFLITGLFALAFGFKEQVGEWISNPNMDSIFLALVSYGLLASVILTAILSIRAFIVRKDRSILLLLILVAFILLILYFLRACYWGIVYNTFPWD